ncbi:Acylphosphatase-1 [Formica fusca]|uniref:acylphosphatase-1-like isoform X2 n=1 Tax=Formica exsecta TaxID=72781 RepID=UPI001141D97E|nr:acylphosphatase-1-like isoform X2 [Formica exsecta]
MIGFTITILFCSLISLSFLEQSSPHPGHYPVMSRMFAVDFEVFGVVQGVFFRKYTQKRGKELGLKGWCMNTSNGTVVGRLEGEKSQVEEMKQWLRHTGSPQSRIDKAEFRNEKEISQPSFSNFEIRK